MIRTFFDSFTPPGKSYQRRMDLLRKSGEFFVMKEDLDDQAEAANEGI
jgi:hypothetical protein